MIQVDIWGPTMISLDSFRYFLTIVDDFTRFTWVIFMKDQSEATALIPQFYAMAKNQFNKTKKVIRTDNGAKFIMFSFYANNGIIH